MGLGIQGPRTQTSPIEPNEGKSATKSRKPECPLSACRSMSESLTYVTQISCVLPIYILEFKNQMKIKSFNFSSAQSCTRETPSLQLSLKDKSKSSPNKKKTLLSSLSSCSSLCFLTTLSREETPSICSRAWTLRVQAYMAIDCWILEGRPPFTYYT